MYVCEKLKLNKFRDVVIPEPKQLFARFGFNSPAASGYTGEEPAIMPMSKVEQLEAYAKYAEQEAAKASNKDDD